MIWPGEDIASLASLTALERRGMEHIAVDSSRPLTDVLAAAATDGLAPEESVRWLLPGEEECA